MKTLTRWQARQKELEDKYVELMLAKYPLLTDVTTNTQRKNGTRMFELNHKKYGPSRFATYKTGMVRKIIRTRFGELSCYQLNPQRSITNYYMTLSDNSELNMRSYVGKQRVRISNGLARLVYLEKYLIKNWDLDSVQDIIEVNGVLYKKI
tara:strand:- start:361 stop:813 length:453 start_codon:yes stop_codon:yes gene_type:complete